MTRSNLAAPWLNFEAGALSKSFDKGRVSPFLFQIERNEVTGPLLQFQSTLFERDDLLKLLRSINASCDTRLDDSRLEIVFDVWWPKLEAALNSIADLTGYPDDDSTNTKRSTEDVVNEILTLVRTQQKILVDQTELVPYLEFVMQRQDPRLHNAWHRLLKELIALKESSQDGDIEQVMNIAHEVDFLIRRMTTPDRARRALAARRRVDASSEIVHQDDSDIV